MCSRYTTAAKVESNIDDDDEDGAITRNGGRINTAVRKEMKE